MKIAAARARAAQMLGVPNSARTKTSKNASRTAQLANMSQKIFKFGAISNYRAPAAQASMQSCSRDADSTVSQHIHVTAPAKATCTYNCFTHTAVQNCSLFQPNSQRVLMFMQCRFLPAASSQTKVAAATV